MDINYNYQSNNFWAVNPTIAPIQGIVVHGTAGSFSSSLSELTVGGASSSYIIDTNGAIYCLVDPYKDMRSWANGIWQEPDLSIGWLASLYRRGINPNLRTISIEHVASSSAMYGKQKMPQVQQEASLWLCDKLLRDFRLPRNGQSIIGHYQIQKYERAYCPGVIDVKEWNEKTKIMDKKNVRVFPETGKTVSNYVNLTTFTGFLDFWNKNGSLRIFGLPLTDMELDITRNKYVQWFERARFEFNPSNPDPYKVELGRVGAEILGVL